MQVFDTHRLSYRSAKLRAWSNITKTTPVIFYDITDPGSGTETTIGTEVVTDSAGYLFYANGTTKVNCLVVHDPCIIEVSLDGGSSWLIQWITKGDVVAPLTTDDIYALSYYDDQHNRAQYNPVLGATQLPDYLRRDEFTPGIWGEGEIILEDGDNSAEVNQWTHAIRIKNSAASTITITGSLRAGQIVAIRCARNVSFVIDGTPHSLEEGTYLWWFETLVTNISYVTDVHIASLITTALNNALGEYSITYRYRNDAGNVGPQTLTPEDDVVPNTNSIAIICYDAATSSGDMTLTLKEPTRLGTINVVIIANRTDTGSASDINLKIGNGTAVTMMQFTVGQSSRYAAAQISTFIGPGVGGDHKYIAIEFATNSVTVLDYGVV